MQLRWTGLALGLGMMALLGASCWQGQARPLSANPNPTPEEISMPPTDSTRLANAATVDAALVQAQTAFGLSLFATLRQETPQENVLISPTSVALALSMAYNGAGGETQRAMAETLRLQGIEVDQLNQGNQALQQYLAEVDPEIELAMANSLWANQDLPLYAEFIRQMQASYGAEVAEVDFTNLATIDRINAWVSQQTRDRIPTIVDTLDPDQLLFLINAVYFKGPWTTAFDPDLTTDRPFTLADGTTLQQPAMQQQGEFLYLETDQFQAVSLPYGNQSLSFEVILPAAGVDLANFYQQLTPENWQTWMMQRRSRPGTVQLPRFQMAYEADLIPALEALGMGVAFSNGADFSGLTSLEAAINQVRHKTFMEVTEVGTEAAAVTSVGIVATSIPVEPEPPFVMAVDRPFLVAIRDQQTGTLLFLGSIMDPR